MARRSAKEERHASRHESAGDENEYRPRPKAAGAAGAERRGDCGTDGEYGCVRLPDVSYDGMTSG